VKWRHFAGKPAKLPRTRQNLPKSSAHKRTFTQRIPSQIKWATDASEEAFSANTCNNIMDWAISVMSCYRGAALSEGC
jgi:hypothetical protein